MTAVAQSPALRRHVRSGTSSRSWKCVSALPGIPMLTRTPSWRASSIVGLGEAAPPELARVVFGAAAKRVPTYRRRNDYDERVAARHDARSAAFEE